MTYYYTSYNSTNYTTKTTAQNEIRFSISIVVPEIIGVKCLGGISCIYPFFRGSQMLFNYLIPCSDAMFDTTVIKGT